MAERAGVEEEVGATVVEEMEEVVTVEEEMAP